VTRFLIRGRRPRYDVVFYTPWIGRLISSTRALPPGGAETQVLMLAKALARANMRVAVIAYGKASELPRQVDGVTIVPRPVYKTRRPLIGKLAETFHIWRALWSAPARTIVNRGAGLQLGLIALYARLSRSRLVFASANVVDFEYEKITTKRRDLLLYRLGVRLADAIVVQTEEQVDMCRSAFGRQPVMIKSIEPLADPQDHAPVAFLWVGRLVSYKRPLEYIELARKLPEATFWMVGVPISHHEDDQHLAAAAIEQARDVPNLEVLPPMPHAEVQDLMARAVASVNTADFEGMPNVLLEAWARGVPALVLTHDPGGVVTREGLGGFAQGSPTRLAELAREQWVARGNRRALAARCRAYIETHHAPERIAAEWRQVLSGSTPVVTELPLPEARSKCAA
jgi:glycosyltransferase involved in cell wall biosynthesis